MLGALRVLSKVSCASNQVVMVESSTLLRTDFIKKSIIQINTSLKTGYHNMPNEGDEEHAAAKHLEQCSY